MLINSFFKSVRATKIYYLDLIIGGLTKSDSFFTVVHNKNVVELVFISSSNSSIFKHIAEFKRLIKILSILQFVVYVEYINPRFHKLCERVGIKFTDRTNEGYYARTTKVTFSQNLVRRFINFLF